MNSGWPEYEAELKRRLPWRAGRELDLPESGVKVVTVRDGEMLVSDGPFAETKEFIAGLDIFECADIDEAIELEGKSPVARFLPFEIRTLPDSFRVGPAFAPFADSDDSEGIPFLLITWAGAGEPDSAIGDDALAQRYESWQRGLEERGVFILGGTIGEPSTAMTLRTVDGAIQNTPGSFIVSDAHVSGVDVIRAADWPDAVAIAAGHPLARSHAIELRSFYSGTT